MKVQPAFVAATLALLASVSAKTSIIVDLQSCVGVKDPVAVAYNVGAKPPSSIKATSFANGVFKFDAPDFSGDEVKIQVFVGDQKPKGGDNLDVGVPYTLITLRKNPNESKPSTVDEKKPDGYQPEVGKAWLADATFYDPSGPNPFEAKERSLQHTTAKADQNVGILYCRLIADARLQQS